MKKILHNQKLHKVLTYAAWKIFGTLVVVLTAGGAIWAMASFTEPSTGPAASVQDFAKNILGANNADNGFDSSAVTANRDGSIIERLENLENKSAGGVTAISAQSASGAYTNTATAAAYCRDLSAQAQYAIDGSNTSTTYTDWHLPSVPELKIFDGLGSADWLVSGSFHTQNGYSYSAVVPLNGGNATGYFSCNGTNCFVRCVR